MPSATSAFIILSLPVAGVFAAFFLHVCKRKRLHRDLAGKRGALTDGRMPVIRTMTSPPDLRAAFQRDHIVRVEDFLTAESLAALRAECEANRHRAERSYIPRHKKGGTLSYAGIHHHARSCLAFYHAPQVQQWLSAVVGEALVPTADHDQSSCSILYYDQAGDHINWHYDHNFYRGRHFTVLLTLVNRSVTGGVSAGRLMQRLPNGAVVEWDTSENALVMFEGSVILHRATPIDTGDQRVMLSMTLCTNPGIGPLQELLRRVKDTAYFGPRVLID
jgi:hypothetical protein